MPVINQSIESIDDLKNVLHSAKTSNLVVIIKFTASWCKPCKIAKPIIDKEISRMSNNILYYTVDIDKQIDIYIKLKSKKMISGIPALIAWYPRDRNNNNEWFIIDNSVNGTNEELIASFFKQCNDKAL